MGRHKKKFKSGPVHHQRPSPGPVTSTPADPNEKLGMVPELTPGEELAVRYAFCCQFMAPQKRLVNDHDRLAWCEMVESFGELLDELEGA